MTGSFPGARREYRFVIEVGNLLADIPSTRVEIVYQLRTYKG